jgi:hypothetical protein
MNKVYKEEISISLWFVKYCNRIVDYCKIFEININEVIKTSFSDLKDS